MSSLFAALVILGLFSFITKKIKFLDKYRIPVSLSSSILVLIFFTVLPEYKNSTIFVDWKSWPEQLIALVFASLFLEKNETTEKASPREIILEGVLVWISVLGQSVLGIFLTLLIFGPVFGLPPAFGMVLETGFAGGHGTAFAMEKSFESNGLAGGLEFGLFSATVGLIAGIAGGIYLIHREGKLGEISKEDFPEIALEPSAFLIGFLLLFSAYFAGVFFKSIVSYVYPEAPGLPLFVYALIAGVLLKSFLKFIKQDGLINNTIIGFITTIVMEILIFAGIATINLKVITDSLIPLLLLFAAGFFWNLFTLRFLSKLLIKHSYRFHLNIINFGMLNGTTATGLMLWKMADPDLKSQAPKIYAAAA
ncbi:MAG: hypothetical protein K8R21_05525, partial [Leptospira sp.]|nr:hypothetical protein [Leptospira sp.]